VADGKNAIEAIRKRFPDAVVSADSCRDQHWVCLKRESLVEVCRFLKDDPATDFDFLVDVTAVHHPDDAEPFELVYHLCSYGRNDRLRVKTRADAAGTVPSLTCIWESANWNERETYDMFGITFAGHPDLRRILMPDDYTDFPLRKEFPLYSG
jgi:NADH/F420H2 dehydrogenase subunit C